MNILIDWVTQIILFVLLAMIIELMLPNSSMKKYINLVVGLLLILIFLQPLFQLFRVDVDTLMESVTSEFNLTMEQENMKNSIELKKNEIQASQDAYVVEEMAVQMKNQVKEGLGEEYGVAISDISLKFNQNNVDVEALEEIELLLSKQESNIQEPVDEVTIEIGENQKQEVKTSKEKEISTYLAEKWQLDKQLITILWEGGV